jgi:hypothetical protein
MVESSSLVVASSPITTTQPVLGRFNIGQISRIKLVHIVKCPQSLPCSSVYKNEQTRYSLPQPENQANRNGRSLVHYNSRLEREMGYGSCCSFLPVMFLIPHTEQDPER